MENIRVLIVDEHPLFRRGARCVLEEAGGCQVIGEASNSIEALDLSRETSPDVVLLDALLSSGDALEVARQMRNSIPHVAIIMLTAFENEEQLFQSIKVGAAAYYHKNITPEQLITAVHRVSQGDYLINDDVLSRPQVASRVLNSFRETFRELDTAEEPEAQQLFSPLSSREVEILDYIARGNSNKEIAKLLKISDQTVKNHITSILKKLSVNDRTAAVVHALRHGWIKIDANA
jgi:DNA-binding NarL/FixJ family response regulator